MKISFSLLLIASIFTASTSSVFAQTVSRQGLTRGTSGTNVFSVSEDPYQSAMLGVKIDCVSNNQITPKNSPTPKPSLPKSSPTPSAVSEIKLSRVSLTGLVAFPTLVSTQASGLCKWPSVISIGRPIDTNYCIYTGAVGGLYQHATSLALSSLPVPEALRTQVDTTRPLSLITVGAPEITFTSSGVVKNQKLQLSTGRSISYDYNNKVHTIKNLTLRGLNPNTSDYEIAGSIVVKDQQAQSTQPLSTLTLSYFDKVKNTWISAPQAFQCTSVRGHIDEALNIVQ